jgi:hypothetical protein
VPRAQPLEKFHPATREWFTTAFAAPTRDGWTPERRRRFLELLTAGLDVRRACAKVGLSRQAAYTLRRRDAGLAGAWDDALRAARAAEDQAFLAMLPERLLRTLSGLSGDCKLREDALAAREAVNCVARV